MPPWRAIDGAVPMKNSWIHALALGCLLAVPPTVSAMSEKAEIKLGREQHQQVIAEMGVYDNDAVQAT